VKTIKSKQEFEKVFSSGRRVNRPLVRMIVLRTGGACEGRVAFVAPKRLGNAVFRNRCKRVLREAAREADLPLDGTDVILMATRSTHDAVPSDVAATLGKALRHSEG